MSTVHQDSLRLPVRILAGIGGAGLATLTLVDRGATRMHAMPWNWLLAVTLAIPPLLLLVRLRPQTPTLKLPKATWLMVAISIAVIPVLSALGSPYRGSSLLMAAAPLAATCLFFSAA